MEDRKLNVVIGVNIFNLEKFLVEMKDAWSEADFELRLLIWDSFFEHDASEHIPNITELEENLRRFRERYSGRIFHVHHVRKCRDRGAVGCEIFKETYKGTDAGINALKRVAHKASGDLRTVILDRFDKAIKIWEAPYVRQRADEIRRTVRPVVYTAADYGQLGDILCLLQRDSEAYEVWLKMTKVQRQRAFMKLLRKFGGVYADVGDVMRWVENEYSNECFYLQRVSSYDIYGKVSERTVLMESEKHTEIYVREMNEKNLKLITDGHGNFEDFRLAIADRNGDSVVLPS